MTGKTLLVLAAIFLAGVSGAQGLTLPNAVKVSGDPDEFQARQVLDEGLVLGHTTDVPECGTGDNGSGQTAVGADSARRTSAGSMAARWAGCAAGRPVASSVGRPRISIAISGEVLLGKQRSRLLGG
ncbi:MAG: hypothetical protein WAW06_03295 [bacterium]